MSDKRTTELRLALVCYGGVSLAIYMHGVTKELHKLVIAARKFDEMPGLDGANTCDEGTTEWAYFEALRAIAKSENGRRLSVSIDVIAGASAGGINGVVLAKAIARKAEQEGLKRLWLVEGDIKKLLRWRGFGNVKWRLATAAVRQLLQFGKATSPLKGEQMSKLLVGALEEMDESGSATSNLMPDAGSVELFVTVTDLDGFSVLVPSGAGGASQRDRAHEQVVEFQTQGDDTEEFGDEANCALAFAARATSSFPGAFAPVSVGSFVTESVRPWDPDGSMFRYPYDENNLVLANRWFVDGGTLNNAPFDLAVDAIAKRRAEREVLRRIVYIQPDPGRVLEPVPSAPGHDAAPSEAKGFLKGVWQALGGARTSHSIVPDLLRIQDMNARIAEVGAIVVQQDVEVLRQIAEAVGPVQPTANEQPADEQPADEQPAAAGSDAERQALQEQVQTAVADIDAPESVRQLSDRLHTLAEQRIGPTMAIYQRLKLQAAGHRFADEIAQRLGYPPHSARATFIHGCVVAWLESLDEWKSPDSSALVPLLKRVDLPYRERRLMFLLAGVNGMYDLPDGPPPAQLNQLKTEAWNRLEGLRNAIHDVVMDFAPADLAFLSPEAVGASLYTPPAEFAAVHAGEITGLFTAYGEGALAFEDDSGVALWPIFRDGTQDWPVEQRMALLSRYLGFPLWDGLIFPVIALSELPQLTPMAVTQFSPLAASALKPMDGEEEKLKGVSFHHFSAFFEREYRENDYLWGRLDGAELIMRTLFGEGKVVPLDALQAAGGQQLVAALKAILSSENDLSEVRTLRDHIAVQVRAMGSQLGG